MIFTESSGLLLLGFVPLFFLFTTRALRRRRTEISSFHVVREIVDSLPLLPRSFLLRKRLQVVLLLVAVILAALAAGGPVVGTPSAGPIKAVIVLDHLANWKDSDSRDAGWEGTISKALSVIRQFHSDDEILLIRSDTGAVTEGFVTPRRASSLLTGLWPSERPISPESVADYLLILEETHRPEFAAIVTPSPSRWEHASKSRDRSWRIVRSSSPAAAPNFSILDVDIRPDLLHPGRFSLFCRVGVFTPSGTAMEREASVTVRVNDRKLARRSLTLRDGDYQGLVFPELDVAGGLLSLQLDPADVFPGDNRYTTPVRSRPFLKAELVTTGNHALESALRSLPGLSLTVSGPAKRRPAEEGAVAVYDGILPEEVGGNTLLIRPFGRLAELEFKGETLRPEVIDADETHLLLTGVSFKALEIKSMPTIIPGASLEVIARADGHPFLLAGESLAGGRMAVLAFDPVESGWIYDPSFPILVANLVSWLSTEVPGSRSSYRVGDRMAGKILKTARSITDPAGNVLPLSPAGKSAYILPLAGRYGIRGDTEESSGEVFANLLDEEVSRAMTPGDGGGGDPLSDLIPARPFRVEMRNFLLMASVVLLLLEVLAAPAARVGRLPQ